MRMCQIMAGKNVNKKQTVKTLAININECYNDGV